MNADLPFSPASERNRAPILDALRNIASPRDRVFEVGAGTGQHAVYLADALDVHWLPSELPENLPGIRGWIASSGARQVLEPVALNAASGPWPASASFDGVFSANTAHILGWEAVLAMFAGIAEVLRGRGWFALYGPFNENGRFTSEGNERLDAWARASFPGAGLRDRAAVEAAARDVGLLAETNLEMPANNRMLVFRRGLDAEVA